MVGGPSTLVKAQSPSFSKQAIQAYLSWQKWQSSGRNHKRAPTPHSGSTEVTTVQKPCHRRTLTLTTDLPLPPALPQLTPVRMQSAPRKRGGFLAQPGQFIGKNYQVLHEIGQGEFGNVYKCLNTYTQAEVALKVLDLNVESVEEEVLKRLENVKFAIQMKEHFEFRDHKCIVMDLVETDMYVYIKQLGPIAEQVHLKQVAWQISKALQAVHEKKFVHGDLKPENIGVDKDRTVKLLDFGSCISLSHSNLPKYIQSRSYRAPEVVFGIEYGSKVDMWSLGCVLVELFTGHVLFQSSDEFELIEKITEVLGPIPPTVLHKLTPRKTKIYSRISNSVMHSLSEILLCADKDFVDFLENLLKWEESERLSAEEALKHRWLMV